LLGVSAEAVARLREILKDYPPSSPSVALFKDGKPVYVMHRFQIEQSDPFTIAKNLTAAFDQHCATLAVTLRICSRRRAP
jgi:putative YphP/YqiW family bacilliredoxin